MNFQGLFAFINEFKGDKNNLYRVGNEPIFQFGDETLRLLMAQFLPVRPVETNTISEDIVRVGGGFVANDGSEMSQPQIKTTSATGMSVTVSLGYQDIAAQMNALQMRELTQLIRGNDRTLARQYFTDWLTTNLRLAIEKKTEIQRNEALLFGRVTVTPIDGGQYTVEYPVRPGSRVTIPSGTLAAPTGFYGDDYNPLFEYFVPLQFAMRQEGYEIAAIVTSSRIQAALQTNKQLALMGAGTFRFQEDGTIRNVAYQAISSPEAINALFRSQGLPPLTIYDDTYEIQTNQRRRFFPEDKILIIPRTTREENINWVDYKTKILKRQLIRGTLGYVAQGIALGQSNPGVVTTVTARELKPIGVFSESYTLRFPILMDSLGTSVATIPLPA